MLLKLLGLVFLTLRTIEITSRLSSGKSIMMELSKRRSSEMTVMERKNWKRLARN